MLLRLRAVLWCLLCPPEHHNQVTRPRVQTYDCTVWLLALTPLMSRAHLCCSVMPCVRRSAVRGLTGPGTTQLVVLLCWMAPTWQ